MNAFTQIKLWLAAEPGRSIISIDLDLWYESGIRISGFTHETPGKNLEAWARHQGHYACNKFVAHAPKAT